MSDKVEVKELTFEELEKLVFSKKADVFQKMKYAELLQANSQVELKAEKDTRIEKIFDLMEELEISKQDMLDKLKIPAVLIFQYNEHKRYEGERGKMPAWTYELKKLSKSEVMKFVVNGNDKGKKFVETIFK